MTVIYAVLAALSLLMVIGYGKLVHKPEKWIQVLFVCIFAVNAAYAALSAARTVEWALAFNTLAYFGSVFLSMCMFLAIYRLCGYTHTWRLPLSLTVLALVMFAIVCTPLYYESVSLTVVDGATKLVKEYGPLHNTYLVYLVGYFVAMTVTIVRSIRRHRLPTQKHAILLAGIVLVNIGFWFIEKFIPWNFEFLSVSYLFSEGMLVGLQWILQDTAAPVLSDAVASLLTRLPADITLNPREREVLSAILAGVPRKEIAAQMSLSENTIKTHTRNLYKKLGVGNRQELYALVDE
jgi:DNA-binding CsgD family transcriptional regulator